MRKTQRQPDIPMNPEKEKMMLASSIRQPITMDFFNQPQEIRENYGRHQNAEIYAGVNRPMDRHSVKPISPQQYEPQCQSQNVVNQNTVNELLAINQQLGQLNQQQVQNPVLYQPQVQYAKQSPVFQNPYVPTKTPQFQQQQIHDENYQPQNVSPPPKKGQAFIPQYSLVQPASFTQQQIYQEPQQVQQNEFYQQKQHPQMQQQYVHSQEQVHSPQYQPVNQVQQYQSPYGQNRQNVVRESTVPGVYQTTDGLYQPPKGAGRYFVCQCCGTKHEWKGGQYHIAK